MNARRGEGVGGRVGAVQHEGVEVQVAVEGGAETLDLVDGTPALVIVGLAQSVGLPYLGLGLLAAGSPAERQGMAMGIFRSMDSLARALGPILGGPGVLETRQPGALPPGGGRHRDAAPDRPALAAALGRVPEPGTASCGSAHAHPSTDL